MPTVAPLLAALNDALSALTQGHRSIQPHFPASAPELTRNLVPYQLEGEEHVCGGVRYRVQLLSRSHQLSLKGLQGLPMAMEIKDGQGGGRIVSGIVSRAEQLLSDGASTPVPGRVPRCIEPAGLAQKQARISRPVCHRHHQAAMG